MSRSNHSVQLATHSAVDAAMVVVVPQRVVAAAAALVAAGTPPVYDVYDVPALAVVLAVPQEAVTAAHVPLPVPQ